MKTRTLPSGFIRAEFTPDRVGNYVISIRDGAMKYPQPLTVRVFDPLLVRLRDKSESCHLGQDFSFKGILAYKSLVVSVIVMILFLYS